MKETIYVSATFILHDGIYCDEICKDVSALWLVCKWFAKKDPLTSVNT